MSLRSWTTALKKCRRVSAAVSPVEGEKQVIQHAFIDADRLAALVTLVRPGGVVVNTVVSMEAPTDETRGVRGVNVFVRSDAEQLSKLVSLVDRGELRVDIAQRVPLTDLPTIHAKADNGTLPGKVVVVAPSF